MSERGFGIEALSVAATEGEGVFKLCCAFGAKQKRLAVIFIQPDGKDPNSGRFLYEIDARNYGRSFMMYDTGFHRHICLFKTAPILQAAMEYYLKSKGIQRSASK